jgi:hypothetical protein
LLRAVSPRALHVCATVLIALAFGGLVVSALVIPGLTDASTLVDANLARTLAVPLELRASGVVALSCLGVVGVVASWLSTRWAQALAVATALVAIADRMVVLPRLHKAWTLVDLVAMRPLDRVEEAGRLVALHHGLGAVIGAGLVGLLWLSTRALSTATATARQPAATTSATPTADDALGATITPTPRPITGLT